MTNGKLPVHRPARVGAKWARRLAWLSPVWVAVLAGCAQPHAGMMGKMTVRVVDGDTGAALAGAEVEVGFSVMDGRRGWGGRRTKTKRGRTAEDGCCTLSAFANDSRVSVGVKAEGYGERREGFSWTNWSWGIPFRLQPWNPEVSVEMHRIGTPTAMIRHKIDRLEIPARGESFGFDLVAGDWVEPNGRGTTADLSFRWDFAQRDRHGEVRRVVAEFANPADGMAPAPIPLARRLEARTLVPWRFLRTAPERGYAGSVVRDWTSGGEFVCPVYPPDEDGNYYLRIRGRRKSDGTVSGAHYGKIYGDVQVFPVGEDGCSIGEFTVYLNPAVDDHNVEFGGSWSGKTAGGAKDGGK